jgi:radical SAM/Cys-rich protein
MEKNGLKSLHGQNKPLASSAVQLEWLANGTRTSFAKRLQETSQWPLKPRSIDVFQVNLGYMCNQVCKHCHVDAGPDRPEIMTRETMQHCLDAMARSGAQTLDLTGGAPEMNPDFRWFVEEASRMGVREIIVRCNLTIILANKKFHDLPAFFARHRIHVISSLPHYDIAKTDRQRGEGVFNKSIEALRMLNSVGYGMPGSDLILDLVYNPAGAFLHNNQKGMEADFKQALDRDFGIHFNQLFSITNMPISRYLEYLIASENFEDYMDLLVQSFNPAAVENVMCRQMISVAWDGKIYDCDFNQMLELGPSAGGRHISELDPTAWNQRDIVVASHCYGCTAGAGSSCQGTLTDAE